MATCEQIRATLARYPQAKHVVGERHRFDVLRYRADGHTLKETGAAFGVGANRIRQIEEEALDKLEWAAVPPNTPEDFYWHERFSSWKRRRGLGSNWA